MAKSHEEVIEGNLQQQLPGHDGEPLGHDVLPEELFEDGEGGLGHPPEAIADLPLPPISVPQLLHHYALPGGAAPCPAEFFLTLMASSIPNSSRKEKLELES